MADISLKRLKKRAERATEHRRRMDPLLDELYELVMPFRAAGKQFSPGQSLTDNLFDATAVEAWARFSGRMQQEVTPPFQEWFSLSAGPALKVDKATQKAIDEDLESISAQVVAGLSTSNFITASAEMYMDLFGGTGALLMRKGPRSKPIEAVSVPVRELALELGPNGDIWGRYWVREWPAWQLLEMWPDGVFADDLKQAIAGEDDKPIEICQACVWSPERDKWVLYVFRQKDAKSDEPVIWREEYRSSPWVTPRYMVVPGEPWGRGPGMLMLPFVKTLNKAREMQLKAAAFALYGIWMSRDDSFNIDTMRFEPGAVWTVGSTGGVLGPSVQRLEVPGKMDLSAVVVEDEREQIARIGLNRRLPPPTGAVRSPTEIMERVRDLDIDLGGVFGRLALEIVQPVVQRGIDILFDHKVLETRFTVDQLTLGVRVRSAIATGQGRATAKNYVDYMQIIRDLAGPEALPLHVRTESAFHKIGRGMSIDEADLRSAEEQAQMMQQMQAQMQAQAQAEAAASAPPPEPIDPNGAAV